VADTTTPFVSPEQDSSFASAAAQTPPASGGDVTNINSTLQTIVQNLSQLLAAINALIQDAT